MLVSQIVVPDVRILSEHGYKNKNKKGEKNLLIVLHFAHQNKFENI